MKFEFKGYHFIVTSDKIVKILGRLISLGNNAMAITFYPFIFVRKDKRDCEELIRHESIHIIQQLELLLVGAWILFVFEYLYARCIKKIDARQAYYFTAMEQEAHRNAIDEKYLSTRKPYSVLKYIFNKKKLYRDINNNLIIKDY